MEIIMLFVILSCAEARFNHQLPVKKRQIQNFGRPVHNQREIMYSPAPGLAFDQASEKQSQCKTIPREFGLCYGMEYHRMRLPNLLGHETMQEVLQQARPWPPLVSKGCHSETRKFLCSLYAPVCIKSYGKSIQPCRSLCESVRDACSPTMAKFRFPWPKMLNCSQYPDYEVNKLCIPPILTETTPVLVKPKTCLPCRQKKVAASIRNKYCTFDFVMRVRVKHLEYDQGRTQILINRKSQKIFRNPLSIPKSKRTSLWMRDGLHCTCNVIKNVKTSYLVTGWKEDDSLLLHSITRWNKKYKRIIRKLKKSICTVKS